MIVLSYFATLAPESSSVIRGSGRLFSRVLHIIYIYDIVFKRIACLQLQIYSLPYRECISERGRICIFIHLLFPSDNVQWYWYHLLGWRCRYLVDGMIVSVGLTLHYTRSESANRLTDTAPVNDAFRGSINTTACRRTQHRFQTEFLESSEIIKMLKVGTKCSA